MLLTAELLQDAMGCTSAVARRFDMAAREASKVYEINNPARLAAFIAQTGHESQNLTALSENLNYSAERLREICLGASKGSRWRSLLPRVPQLARNPQALGNAAYGGRMGNGPELTGDGYRYRARGPIGVTGKVNYESMTELLAEKLGGVPDFVLHPELLESPQWGMYAAAAFWFSNGCNELADLGKFDAITEKVNGGSHGAADRRARYKKATPVVKAAAAKQGAKAP